MGSIHGLRVIGWVPVMVIKYDSIRSGQIDAQPACPRAEQEHEYIGPGTKLRKKFTPTQKTCELASSASQSPYLACPPILMTHQVVDTCIVGGSDTLP